MKNAYVAGASGGIGSAIVESLIKDGFKVWGTYHQDQAAADKLTSAFGKDKVQMLSLNITDEKSVKEGISDVLKNCKQLDAVIYSVTHPVKYEPFLRSQWNSYQQHFENQVKGFYYLVQALQTQIQAKQRLRLIVILTEYCVGKPMPGISNYETAKYALMGFAKSLAVELSSSQTTVNMISPGMTETDLISYLPPKAVEMTRDQNPLKRIAIPQDVANVVSFLASEKADYLNGVNILVNGGGTML